MNSEPSQPIILYRLLVCPALRNHSDTRPNTLLLDKSCRVLDINPTHLQRAGHFCKLLSLESGVGSIHTFFVPIGIYKVAGCAKYQLAKLFLSTLILQNLIQTRQR